MRGLVIALSMLSTSVAAAPVLEGEYIFHKKDYNGKLFFGYVMAIKTDLTLYPDVDEKKVWVKLSHLPLKA